MARDKSRRTILAHGGLEVGNPTIGNYLGVDDRGHLVLHGAAVQWDDLRVDGATTRVGAIAPTDETGFRGDSNHSVRNFVHNQADEVQFSVQLPHTWREGSTLHPHVHFSPWITGSASTNTAAFTLEYYWANHGDQFPATTASIALTEQWQGNRQWYHMIADNATGVSASGKTISSLLKCRLYRDNTAASNLAGKVTFLYFDIHYQISGFGSDEEYTK